METKTVKAVEQFANVAKRYLVWANSWSGTPEENALTVFRLLPELYLAAVALPNMFPDKPGKDPYVMGPPSDETLRAHPVAALGLISE